MTLAPGRYRHFKGNLYDVLGVARHSETYEAMVIYRPVESDGQISKVGDEPPLPRDGWWVRSLEMFIESVDRDGYQGPRFTKID